MKIELIPLDRQRLDRMRTGTHPEPLASILEATSTVYERTGQTAPWLSYLAVFPGTDDAVGICSFRSNPVHGAVEISYFTFPDFEGRGIGSAMAAGLVKIARAENPTITVTACTLEEENASAHILRNLGFVKAGIRQDPHVGEVVVWQLPPR